MVSRRMEGCRDSLMNEDWDGIEAIQCLISEDFQKECVPMIFADGSVLLKGEEEDTYVVETHAHFEAAARIHSS